MTLSVLIVDDHAIFRKSVRILLETTTDYRIVGEAGDDLEALALAERLQPDVVLVDYVMPRTNGVDIIRKLCARRPGTRVIMLSMHNDEAYVLEALKHGARGYILKEDSAAHLAPAIAAVAAGQTYFSPSLREGPAQADLLNSAAKEGMPIGQ